MGGFAEKMEDFTVFVRNPDVRSRFLNPGVRKSLLNPDVRNYLAAFLEDRLKQLFKFIYHCETSGLED
jgi:hypothetical protein